MKIVSETPQRLHVRHAPWVLRGLFILFALIGLVGGPFSNEIDSLWERLFVFALGVGAAWLGWWATPILDVVFDRASGTATVRHIRFIGSEKRTVPLSGLRARQGADWSTDSGGRLVRLVLESEGREIPLEKGFGPVTRDPIAAEINRWLEGRPAPPRPAVVKT